MTIYKTQGTCSESIEFDVQDGIITYCKFNGGCTGNVAAVAKLVIGKRVNDVIALLKGIPCHDGTSCPDQLAQALEQFSQQSLSTEQHSIVQNVY
ncbi:MAG TPA: TIGR03905 family TSCPD domain-containing protein [Spirochaetia bacterium]|nr:TIGR03905 family TSCPD domain-containing protein [Spirochaetales bacterium]HRS64629.1 TIGR03905 family TSCPD domain-containing protein [Spirochaetia bacterium]HOT58046.1 TIGR03905 family TSCPD domain-containing protein [Spirochaetales bacterium]HPD80565.1 TIGR03905 family TSCPD domain-containing protein [Spirochaetales bacterium]HQG40354.1 TIGR03905 family TSCPD domain-containing protein [Spirochaetales bacterium]